LALVLLVSSCGRSTRTSEGMPDDAGSGGGGVSGGTARAGTGGAQQNVAGAGGDPAVDDTTCSSDPSEISGLAFDVHLEPLDTTGQYAARDFVFYIDGTTDGLELVVGSPGQAARDGLSALDSELTLEHLRIRNEVKAQFEQPNSLFLEDLRLCVRPEREALPYLSGTGVLHVVQDINDVSYDYTYEVRVSGESDATNPSWMPQEPVNPLDPTPLDVSEPIGSSPVPDLVLDAPRPMPLEPLAQAGVTVAFTYVGVLPLGVALRPTGAARDLAGNPLEAPLGPVLRTPDDPGILTDGSFDEAAPFAVVERAPGLFFRPEISSGPVVISGGASLRIPAGGEVVLHLSAPPEHRHVKLDLLPVVEQLDLPVDVEVRAGVVGGAVAVRSIPVGEDASGAAGAGGSDAQSGVQAIDIPLSETGEDVLLSIRAPVPTYLNQSYVRVHVDNVRME
jgi:hypothetical protein